MMAVAEKEGRARAAGCADWKADIAGAEGHCAA